MSVLAVGISHNSAPIELLDRVGLDAAAAGKLLGDLSSTECVSEALVLATCNRVEVYAEVNRFHAGVQEITELLAAASGVAVDELTQHVYVHYEDKAVEHLFLVAAGLDSMVVGEQQIIGQLRAALALARAESTAGRVLGPLAERALRVGKRVQSETGVGAAGRSLVSVGIEMAEQLLVSGAARGLSSARVAVVGAGSVSSLAAHTLHQAGVSDLVIVNRTPSKAHRLGETLGGRAADWDQLTAVIAEADLVVSCTGATGLVITSEDVTSALAGRSGGRSLVLLDLALPHDVDPAVRSISGVELITLDTLASSLRNETVTTEISAARRMITDEVGSWLARQRADRIAPTVVALRTRAGAVVDAELRRLIGRLPELDERAIGEIRQSMTRMIDKLLHAPTVRIKELAEAPGADSYTQALRDLFAIDAQSTEAVARASVRIDESAAETYEAPAETEEVPGEAEW